MAADRARVTQTGRLTGPAPDVCACPERLGARASFAISASFWVCRSVIRDIASTAALNSAFRIPAPSATGNNQKSELRKNVT